MFEDFDKAKAKPDAWFIVFEEDTFQKYNHYYSSEGGQQFYPVKRIKTSIVEHKELAYVIQDLSNKRISYRVSKFVPINATLTTTVNLDLN